MKPSRGRCEPLNQESYMSEEKLATTATQLGLSLDVWAVLTSFLLALLVRVGVLKHVPW
jgi:hypothetical protein